MLLTFQDTVERLINYLGAQASDTVLQDCKQAAIEALRDLIQAHQWTYLTSHGRINLQPAFTDGLVTYTASPGNNLPNNLITLTGATWPPWANLGVIRIADINYDVSSVVDGNNLTIVASQAPPADITVPSEYGLFQDSYALPDDFITLDQAFIAMTWGMMHYVHPREWLWENSRWGIIGNPVVYTIMPEPDLGGKLAIKFAPFPYLSYPVEFLYKRKAKPLTVFKSSQGTVATTLGSTSILGTGTTFTSNMAGNAVLRISGTAKPPTAEFGENPAIFESRILTVADPQTLTVVDPVPSNFSQAPYTISSRIDIEVGAMEQAYLRCAEMHIGISRILKDKPSARLQYAEALEVAKCADSRNTSPRVAGHQTVLSRRLRDYPVNLSREL